MPEKLKQSAIEFTIMWCNLFVGDSPQIERAIGYFGEEAMILVPDLPYRINRAQDAEEIEFSHLADGRGHIHFWQVLEPHVNLVGEVAVVSYYARYNMGRKGESTIKCAKETLVLKHRKEADEWTIMHLHNSEARKADN